jgi:hypothetical protein
MKQKHAFKSDRFKKNRGGYSRWLLIRCTKCQDDVLVYQKDGPGILKRLYHDRIVMPTDLDAKKNLVCKGCSTILGIPIVYQKEDRRAFRLFAGAVEKKIIKGEKFPKLR